MTSAANCGTCVRCFYCEAVLSPRHEHDHHPLPVRAGGVETVPACINCHDLKDRVRLAHWRSELLEPAMREAGPLGRLLLAKLSALIADFEAAATDERAA